MMDSRQEFVRLAATGDVSIAALCRRFGISRQTGHFIFAATVMRARPVWRTVRAVL